jgi:hypothetical protein
MHGTEIEEQLLACWAFDFRINTKFGRATGGPTRTVSLISTSQDGSLQAPRGEKQGGQVRRCVWLFYYTQLLRADQT